MQKRIFKAAYTWRLILSLLIVATLVACEDTNTVGGNVVDPSALRIDTVFVDNFESQTSNVFSGDVSNPSIGNYSDNLFGDFASTMLIKPRLISRPSPPLDGTSYMQLLLHFEDRPVYGDETSSTDFSIYKVTERWRGTTLNSDDNIMFDESELLGSFTYEDQDSLYIDVSDSLLFDYASYVNDTSEARDSLYNFEFFGIAITADNSSSKIVFPDVAQSRLLSVKVDEDGNDTTAIFFDTQGFNIDRQNTPSFTNRIYLNSLYESYYKINLKEVADLIPNDINILKADLVLYEDTLQLSNTLPANHNRLPLNFFDLKFADESELKYELQFTATDFLAQRDTLDNSFRFDVTNLINSYIFGNPAEEILYMNINPDGGFIRSTIFFDSTASAAVRPKLILKVAE